jgi:hypothetical protein
MTVEHQAASPERPELCTLADVRAIMQTADSDTSQDSLITLFIAGASVAVMEWCERLFAPVEKATRIFEWPRDQELVSFAPYDLQALEGEPIADSDNPTPYVLTTAEYRLYPAAKRHGVYMGIRVRPFGAAYDSNVWRNRQLKVTGLWGFPVIPQDVVEATALTVASRLRNNAAAFRQPDQDQSQVVIPRRGVPLEAQQLVQHLKRPAL